MEFFKQKNNQILFFFSFTQKNIYFYINKFKFTCCF